MSETDDLVVRLRCCAAGYNLDASDTQAVGKLTDEAADALDAKDAEIAELREAVGGLEALLQSLTPADIGMVPVTYTAAGSIRDGEGESVVHHGHYNIKRQLWRERDPDASLDR